MAVPEGQPQPGQTGGRADHGFHVRGAGAGAHPGLRVEPVAQREERAGDGFGGGQLPVVGPGVVAGQLGACGEADAGAHGGEQVAGFGVHQPVVQAGVVAGAVVHVVAAFHEQRHMQALLVEPLRGPGAEGQHHLLGEERVPAGHGLPAVAVARQRFQWRLDEASALLLEVVGVGGHQGAGVGGGPGLGPVDGAGEAGRQVRLPLGERVAIQNVVGDAVLVGVLFRLPTSRVERVGGAEHFQVAFLTNQVVGAGGVDHRRVGIPRPGDQRRVFRDDARVARRRRIAPVLKQGQRGLRHAGGSIADIHPPVGQHPGQRGQIAGEAVGPHGLALDDAGVAERGLAPRRVAVHQGNPVAALQQVPGGGDADHAGAQNQNIAGHVRSCYESPGKHRKPARH